MPKTKSKKKNYRKSKKDKTKTKSNCTTTTLAKKTKLKAFGIYERISRVTIGGKKTWRKNKHKVEDILDNESNFIDKEYVPNQFQLDRLQAQNAKLAKNVSWYKLHSFFQERYSIARDCQIRKQVMKNRGYVWIIDALNVLSVQPGLIFRLFEKKKTVREGVYCTWLNFNGKWTQFIIDDYIPIFENSNGKTQFLFSSPHPKFKEVWYILLEKVLAKAYGGFYRLCNGVENYAVRDLTGAPCSMFDIVFIRLGKELTKREKEHMKKFWKKVNRCLDKGYILSVVPRAPTQLENAEKKNLNIPNKKYYMSNGLYSGHNYAIVSAKEVTSSRGEKCKLVKLRNPWINEKWQGDWSLDSDLWTDETRLRLKYSREQAEAVGNEFWISAKDMMSYFECLNIYKTIPGSTFNSIEVPFNLKRSARSVIRLSVPKKGKYTFSVDQRDLRLFESKELKYSAIRLTLGKLQESGVTLLSHTSSLKLRNTFIRKNLEKGEYYLLIERQNTDQNLKLLRENEDVLSDFNRITVSTYGPKSCILKLVEDSNSNDTIFNYLCYYGWKSYSMIRIGKKMSEFKVNFYDQTWNKLSLYLLNVPDCIIYAFKNTNDFGVELKSQIAGITNKEIVGPEGRISFRQDFSMNPGHSDVFILRDKEEGEEKTDGPVNHKFQIKSVVGRKFFGTKGHLDSFQKVYDFLIQEKGKKRITEIEKDRYLDGEMGLYDGRTFERKKLKNEEVDVVKKKQIINPMKKEEYEDIVQMEEVEKKEKELFAEQQKRRKIEEERKRLQKEKLRVEEEKIRREFEIKNGIVSKDNDQSTEGSPANELENQEEEANLDKTLEFKQEDNVLQVGDPRSRRRKTGEGKNKRGKSILKNRNRNQSREKKNIEELEVMKEKKDRPLDVLLKTTRDQLINLKTSELKTLIKYYTFKGFSAVYKLDGDLKIQIDAKLANDAEANLLLTEKNTQFVPEAELENPQTGIQQETELQSELKMELELQKELEKQLEEQKKLQEELENAQAASQMNPDVSDIDNEEQAGPIQPRLEMEESVVCTEFGEKKDDFKDSRRNKNCINSLKQLQEPLRSMSRMVSPQFDKSVSRRKLENRGNTKINYKSPEGIEIFKQNKNNKITLSQYNGGDDRERNSMMTSKIGSACNYSNLGNNEKPLFDEDWKEVTNLRQSCAPRIKDTRFSYNINTGNSEFTKKFSQKNFRNSSYSAIKNKMSICSSLRGSVSKNALRKSYNFDKIINNQRKEFLGNEEMLKSKDMRESNFSYLKTDASDVGDGNFKMEMGSQKPGSDSERLQRLRKKLEERRRIRQIGGVEKAASIKSSMVIPNRQEGQKKDGPRKHQGTRNRAQDIINKAKSIVKKANQKRVIPTLKPTKASTPITKKTVELSLNDKIKQVRDKARKEFSRNNGPYYNKKMRNTVNLATFGKAKQSVSLYPNKNERNSYNFDVKSSMAQWKGESVITNEPQGKMQSMKTSVVLEKFQASYLKGNNPQKILKTPTKVTPVKKTVDIRNKDYSYMNQSHTYTKKRNDHTFRSSVNPDQLRLGSAERGLFSSNKNKFNFMKSSIQPRIMNNKNTSSSKNFYMNSSALKSASSKKIVTSAMKSSNIYPQNFVSDRKILNETTNRARNMHSNQKRYEKQSRTSNFLQLKQSQIVSKSPSKRNILESSKIETSPNVLNDLMIARKSAMNMLKTNNVNNGHQIRSSYAPRTHNGGYSNQKSNRSNLTSAIRSPRRNNLSNIKSGQRKPQMAGFVNTAVSHSQNFITPKNQLLRSAAFNNGQLSSNRGKKRDSSQTYRGGQENQKKEKQSYLSGVFG